MGIRSLSIVLIFLFSLSTIGCETTNFPAHFKNHELYLTSNPNILRFEVIETGGDQRIFSLNYNFKNQQLDSVDESDEFIVEEISLADKMTPQQLTNEFEILNSTHILINVTDGEDTLILDEIKFLQRHAEQMAELNETRITTVLYAPNLDLVYYFILDQIIIYETKIQDYELRDAYLTDAAQLKFDPFMSYEVQINEEMNLFQITRLDLNCSEISYYRYSETDIQYLINENNINFQESFYVASSVNIDFRVNRTYDLTFRDYGNPDYGEPAYALTFGARDINNIEGNLQFHAILDTEISEILSLEIDERTDPNSEPDEFRSTTDFGVNFVILPPIFTFIVLVYIKPKFRTGSKSPVN